MTIRQKTFRRPDKLLAGKFDDWREVTDDGAVSVFFGTSPGWPPYRRERSEARPASFEEECEGTLARRYVEVDAETGAALVQPTTA